MHIGWILTFWTLGKIWIHALPPPKQKSTVGDDFPKTGNMHPRMQLHPYWRTRIFLRLLCCLPQRCFPSQWRKRWMRARSIPARRCIVRWWKEWLFFWVELTAGEAYVDRGNEPQGNIATKTITLDRKSKEKHHKRDSNYRGQHWSRPPRRINLSFERNAEAAKHSEQATAERDPGREIEYLQQHKNN